MAESNKKGMISGMDALLTISGEEFLEVIRLESDGSYKNYKLLVSKIRNNAGLSAYEIAVQNGFVGTVDEWLASLEGKSAYQIAVDLGFVGDEAAFILSLKGAKGEDGDEGKSIYDIALENGFVGTEADFLKTLIGKSAYQSALDQGFVGTEAEWLLTIKGDKGDDGEQGEIGPDGKSSFEVWQAQPGNAGKPVEDFLAAQKGVTGDSAYESAVAGGFVGTEAAWLKTLEGKSAYEIAKELNPALTDESEFIQSLEGKTAFEVAKANGFTGTEPEWLTSLVGKSAYQIAKDQGFVGTEAQWVASLEGSDGNDGQDGAPGKDAYETYKELPGNQDKTKEEFIASLKGEDGTNGTDGTDGADGESAFDAYKAIPGNEDKTEADFIASIKGEKGTDGTDGTNGTDGDSAYEVAKAAGFVGTVDQWLASLEGAKGDDGKAINVLATITQAEFDDIVADGLSQAADAYIVGEYIHVFNGVDWVRTNSLVGPKGQGLNYLGTWPDNIPLPTGSTYVAGDTYVWKNAGVTSLWTLVVELDAQGQETSRSWVDIGVPGPKGDSAYQSWLKQAGNAGKTEAEFVASIKGEPGRDGTNGTNGTDGDTGPEGKSAYEVAVANGFIGTVAQWEASLKGDTGDTGAKGDPAVAFEIKGRLTQESELPTPGVASEAYYVGKNLFVWLEDDAKWENFGSLNGDSAYQTWLEEPGNTGKTEQEFLESLKGQSAYKLWEAQTGNTGKTEAEFLASLKGVDGVDGTNGTNGTDGTDGRNLQVKGTQANLAAIQALPTPADQDAWVADDTGHLHIYVTNAWIDAGKFRGDDGADGTNGTNGTDGADGADAYQAYIEIPGNEDKTREEFIASLKGADGQDGTNGTNGTDGRNVTVKGSVANQAALPTGAAQQDAYTVRDTGHLFMWIAAVWTDLGQFKGDKGDTGDEGPRGYTGLGLDIVGEYELLADRPDPTTLESGQAVFVLEDHKLYQVNAMGTYNVGIRIEGPQGEDGPEGPEGPPGTGVTIIGKAADAAALQALRPTGPQAGEEGKGWLIALNLYLWLPSVPGAGDESWTDVGTIKGLKGDQGIQGRIGPTGGVGPKGPRGALWLKIAGTGAPTAVNGTEGDWAVNDSFVTFYKSSETVWTEVGTLSGTDLSSPDVGLGKVVRLGNEWVALPIDAVANPEADVFYVRALKSGSTTETEWVKLTGLVKEVTSPVVGKQYVRTFAAGAPTVGTWVEVTIPAAGISEAPTTAGKTYVRSGETKDWVEYVAGITAPADAKKYLRTQTAWVAFDSYDLAYTTAAASVNLDLSKNQMIEVDNSSVTPKIVTLDNIPAIGRCATVVVVVKGSGSGGVSFAVPSGSTLVGGAVKWNGEAAPVYTAGYSVVTLLVYRVVGGNIVIIGATGAQTQT